MLLGPSNTWRYTLELWLWLLTCGALAIIVSPWFLVLWIPRFLLHSYCFDVRGCSACRRRGRELVRAKGRLRCPKCHFALAQRLPRPHG